MGRHLATACTIGWLIFALATPAFGQSWSVEPQVHPPRTRTALAVVKGKIYVIGGQTTDTSCTSRVDVYTPGLKQWSQGTAAPKPLCGHAVAVVGNTIYSFGGSDGNKGSDVVLAYDPAANQWKTLATKLPVARTYHAAVRGQNGRVYLVGGQATGAPLAQVDEFDPATVTWRTRASLPIPLTHMAGARRPCDHRIYVLAENKLQRFDPTTNSWSVMADLPETRSGIALAAGGDDRLYAMGGYGGNPFESADSFVFNGQSWAPGPAMATARGELSAVRFGKRIFAVGGSAKFPGILGTNEALGPIPYKLCVPKEEPTADVTDVRPLLCTWTPWLNRDLPSGSGDYESRADFEKAGSACKSPQKVECRVRANQKGWKEAGQVYTCDPKVGGVCVNDKQPQGSRCLDYEVRFCCRLSFEP